MSSKQRRAKGEGCISRRADGLWRYALDVGKDLKTGKRKRRTLYAKSRAQLLKDVADLRAKSGGSIRQAAVGTVGGWVEQWLEHDVRPNRSRNTHTLYECMWRVHAKPIIGAQKLEKFDVEDVAALYACLRSGGVGPAVIQRVGMVMHRAFNVAIRRRGYKKANPFSLVERPAHSAKEARILLPDEARQFLSVAAEDRLGAMWVVLLTSGLRLGEALALEWRDFDAGHAALTVRQSLSEVNGLCDIVKTKTKGSRRRIDLGKLAVAALKRRRREAASEGHESRFIFTTATGTMLRRSNIRRDSFAEICKKAKVSGLTIHGLRHTMASLALAQGIQPKVVAERLGHSTTRLTMDRYGHTLPGMQREAADALDSLLTARGAPRRRKR